MARQAVAIVLALTCLLSCASAALDTSKYARSKVLKADAMKMYWRIEGDTVHLAVEATATGWVGFGLGETTGMAGADIVYYEAASSKLIDSYAVSHAKPTADSCQDWNLISAEKSGDKLVVEMSRRLVSTDTQDRNITNDAAAPLLPTTVIAAWGDTAEIAYHCSECRVAVAVRFFGTGDDSRLAGLKADTTLKQHVLKVNNKAIAVQETQYAEFCFDVQTLLGRNDSTTPMHVVGFEPFINPASNKKYIHHYTLYGSSQACPDTEPESGYNKGPMVWVWAPGSEGNALPPEAGVRMLGTGLKTLILQIHYDNKKGDKDQVDNSGFRIFYTDTLRAYDAGVLQIGDPDVQLSDQALPSGSSKLTLSVAADSCTNDFAVAEVQVFAQFLHMHQAGARMQSTQLRAGSVVRKDFVDFYDFKQSGAFEPPSSATGVTLQKGDSFLVECWYESAGSSQKRFGLGSSDEMCINFVFYYPLQPVSSNNKCHASKTNNLLPQAEAITGIERIFSTQPASCSVTSVSGSVSRTTPPPTTPPPNQVSAGIRAKGGGMVFGSVIALFAAVFWVL